LTLPGNIIAINYLNGNRVTGGITFDGEAVIGTGTSNTQSGLYLAPDPVSLTNDLYLRVRGNILDEPTHIHFDTGNNQYYNQYIGDDNKYILLANTGNVVVNTNDNAGNSAQWIFNNFGTLSLPGGSQIRPLGANLDIFAGTGSYVNLITSDESSSMGVDNGGGYIVTAGGTWGFSTTGNLTAPGNVSAVGNVTGAYIFGNGSELTNLPAPAVTQDITSNGAMSIMTYDGVIKYVNYATVEPSSGNISAGNISTTGNITGKQVITTPVALGNLTAVSGARAFANDANLVAAGNFGAQVSGGAGNTVPVWSDGANWYIG
jgi:hypothetical protein